MRTWIWEVSSGFRLASWQLSVIRQTNSGTQVTGHHLNLGPVSGNLCLTSAQVSNLEPLWKKAPRFQKEWVFLHYQAIRDCTSANPSWLHRYSNHDQKLQNTTACLHGNPNRKASSPQSCSGRVWKSSYCIWSLFTPGLRHWELFMLAFYPQDAII